MPFLSWAPLNIPLPRRFQTFAVFLTNVVLFVGPMVGSLLFVYLLYSPWWWFIVITYGAYWFLFDHDIASRGGRRFEFIRHLPIWRYWCEYFPIKLHKTADLDPSKTYLMGYHPHGVISMGAFGSFATEGNGFNELFPGIQPHLMTLKINFRWPFHRDLLLGLGLVDVSKESITHVCSKKGPGSAAIIVIGGAAESMEAFPDRATLILKNRKGFVKMAIRCGAQLVPIFSFGENSLVSQARAPWLRQFQDFVRKWSGIAPIVAYGRGIFQYSFGFMPYRVPVHLVVGSPIEVVQCDSPTQEEVDRVHGLYISSLTELYNKHRQLYSKSSEDLKIV